jgi:membrane fusion protein (multidrug efflux system)
MRLLERQTSRVRDAALLTLLGSCIPIFGSCGGGTAASPPQTTTVEVATVIQRDTPIYTDWVATLEGYVNADIQPRVAGYIVKQNYREGTFVRKGDVLFEIDPRPLQAALDQARAQVAQAEAQLAKADLDVERDTPLAAARAIAKSQLDTEVQASRAAQAAVMAAKANVEQAELNLEFTKVTSLVSGIAGIARVQIGNLVGPSSILTSVSQVDPIKTYFTVSEQVFIDFHRRFPTEQSVAEQRRRMPLQLTLGDGSIYEHIGWISFADREVNPATGAIRIAGVFPNPNTLLRPGGYGRVRLSARTVPAALLIPQRAVTELQGSYQVAVVGGDDKVSIRNVTVGDRVGNLWIVTEGVKPGERVIVEGLLKVRNGAVVNVATATKSPETGQ